MSSLNLKEQIQAELARNGISFNIILVGESGLGKSTCIRALFRPFVDRPGHPEENRPASTPAWLAPCHDEIRPRTLTIVEYSMSVESDGIPVEFSVIDCPGYGDQLDANDSIAPILECIRGRFGAHFEALLAGGAGSGRAALDGRVHACLYFIGAHRLKGIDIAFMRALQSHVPILPLIAKADTLTTAERAAFRRHIVAELKAKGIECLDFAAERLDLNSERPSFNSEPSARAAAADGRTPPPPPPRPAGRPPAPSAASSSSSLGRLPASSSSLVPLGALGAPFAVCASESGRREYPWGVCDVEEPAHSDLAALRATLLSSNLLRARERTEELYERAYAAPRRAGEAAQHAIVARRLRRQELALRALVVVGAVGALALVGSRAHARLSLARQVRLTSAAGAVGAGLVGASRATVRGVNAYALSPLAGVARELGAWLRPSAWAASLARGLDA